MVARFRRVRSATGTIAGRLSVEDRMVQSLPEASPAKWHLAHTSWFLERHILAPFLPGYACVDDRLDALFRSGTGGMGLGATSLGATGPLPREADVDWRRSPSRPGQEEVARWRDQVNAAVLRLIAEAPAERWPQICRWLDLALLHEARHQERLLADIKHAFWTNPLRPAYLPTQPAALAAAAEVGWIDHPGGEVAIGHAGPGIAPDLEKPRHTVTLPPFRLAGRLVTCAEFEEFIAEGGYRSPAYWSPEGWIARTRGGWTAPLYWEKRGGLWHHFTLTGTRLVDGEEPVCHVSLYEAQAFAAWSGARLPTEAEWEALAPAGAGAVETAASPIPNSVPGAAATLLESGRLHPAPAAVPARTGSPRPLQMIGDAWEWTGDAFRPYPGQRPGPLAAGQPPPPPPGRMALRGGSALTPGEAVRRTTRLALPPDARWQMTGIRLATDAVPTRRSD
jgi:ergothioneine biosynthesis protein EgtB